MSTELSHQILNAVFAIATPMLVTLVMALLMRLLKRYGLELEAEQQAKLEAFVRRAILKTEEVFAAKIRADVSVTAADKLEHAIDELTTVRPELTRPAAAALIHAQLPLVRAQLTVPLAPAAPAK